VDLTKVLAQLRQELQHLDTAIASLERLAAQKQRSSDTPEEPKRRGRPPKHSSSLADARLAVEKRSGGK
jgi:hypothetical protein